MPLYNPSNILEKEIPVDELSCSIAFVRLEDVAAVDLRNIDKLCVLAKCHDGNSVQTAIHEWGRIERRVRSRTLPGFEYYLAYRTGFYDDVAFVIQGNDCSDTTQHAILICFCYGLPIDSTWTKDTFKPVKSVRAMNRHNIYYHARGTLLGLDMVPDHVRYVVKHRSDEFYTRLRPILDAVRSNPDKIVTSNIFFRDMSFMKRIHISDHIIAGTKENVRALMEETRKFLETDKAFIGTKCAEVIFSEKYLDFKEPGVVQDKQMAIRHFHIVSLKELGDFQVTAHCYKRVYRPGFTNYTQLCPVETIEDI